MNEPFWTTVVRAEPKCYQKHVPVKAAFCRIWAHPICPILPKDRRKMALHMSNMSQSAGETVRISSFSIVCSFCIFGSNLQRHWLKKKERPNLAPDRKFAQYRPRDTAPTCLQHGLFTWPLYAPIWCIHVHSLQRKLGAKHITQKQHLKSLPKQTKTILNPKPLTSP